MICPVCGYSSHDGAKSCLQCGAQMSKEVFRPERFVGLTRRFGAMVIDLLILSVIVLPLSIALGLGENLWAISGMLIGAYIIYGTIFEMTPLQATLGKMAVGARVVSVNGKTLTFTFSFLRNLTKLISVLAIFTGVIVGAMSDEKRCFHDLFGRDLVVPRK